MPRLKFWIWPVLSIVSSLLWIVPLFLMLEILITIARIAVDLSQHSFPFIGTLRQLNCFFAFGLFVHVLFNSIFRQIAAMDSHSDSALGKTNRG